MPRLSGQTSLSLLKDNDYLPVNDSADLSVSPKKVTASVIKAYVHSNGSNVAYFDANVDAVGTEPNCYATINAAIVAGKKTILCTASVSETVDTRLQDDTYIFIMPGVTITTKRFQGVNTGLPLTRYSLKIVGSGRFQSSIIYLPLNSGERFFYDSNELQNCTLVSLTFSNTGELDNTSICEDSALITSDCLIKAGNANNAGANYAQINSRSESGCVYSGGSTPITPALSNAFVAQVGDYYDVRFAFDFAGGAASLIDIQSLARVMDMNFGGSQAITMNVAGLIDNLSNLGVPVNINCTGNDVILRNIDLLNGTFSTGNYTNGYVSDLTTSGTITGSASASGWTWESVKSTGAFNLSGDNQTILGCTALTAIISGNGNQRAGNSQSIGNNYGSSSAIDEFTAVLDNASPLPADHYAGVNQASTALKYYLLSITSITESADTEIADAGEIYLKIGQNKTWSMADKRIGGEATTPNGIFFTVELADSSSIMSFASTATEFPFENFDELSCLVIKGNGGKINNLSTVSGAAIKVDGKLIIKDVQINLPNQSDGGVHTNDLTDIDNLTLNGGGASCEQAILFNGGNVNSLTLTGTFGSIGSLATGSTNIGSINYLSNQALTLAVKGNVSNIKSNAGAVAALTIDCESNTNISNGQFEFITFDESVSNVNISNCKIDNIIFATDNTNQNITINNCIIGELVQAYGTKIKFSNCVFTTGINTQTGSTGSITGCDATNSPTLSGTFTRSGNDAVIGNDY